MDHGANGAAGSCANSCGSTTRTSNEAAACCGDAPSGEDEQARLIAAMKAKLTPMEYMVTQDKVTERPFSNRYNRHFESGSYHCVVCDTEIFRSDTKFESKSGWPAFWNVVDDKRIKLKQDTSHVGANILLLISRPDLARNEVSCAFCKSHLGHLFQDGPKPTGLRYCVNSNSLIFHAKPQDENATATDADSKNTNGNGNLISDPGTPAKLTSNCTGGNDTTDNNNPQKAAEVTIPSGKICININSNGTTKDKEKNQTPRRDSGSAVSSTNANKGKFCIFSQCLPKESTVTSSPETSPTTPKHFYKPSSTNNGKPATEKKAAVNNGKSMIEPKSIKPLTTNNGKSLTENPAAAKTVDLDKQEPKTSKSGDAAVPRRKVKGRAPQPPTTLNLNKDKDDNSQDPSATETVCRFGSDIPSPTSEIIETVTRRPSNGVLRETFL